MTERDKVNRLLLRAIRGEGSLADVKYYVEEKGADVNFSLNRREDPILLEEAIFYIYIYVFGKILK